jgi:TRAP-type C4-dicarboxylate transport system permease small subunit
MRRLLDFWYAVLRVALTLLMAALVVPVTMQILSRYGGFISRYLWTEEVARFCPARAPGAPVAALRGSRAGSCLYFVALRPKPWRQ